MSKVKLKKRGGVKTNEPLKKTVKKNKHAGKKSFFFPHAEKKDKKHVSTDIKPPTDAQEFSSNWKSLLQIIASNPESKPKSTKQPTNVAVKGKELQKNASVSKDSPVKRFNKSATAAERREKTEKSKDQRIGRDSAGHKQYKMEKRKRKDDTEEKERPQNKKMKKGEVAEKKTEPDIWFDDVDPDDIEATVGSEAADVVRKRNGIIKSETDSTEKALVKEHGFEGLTRAIAMDCEMVGVGPDGEESILARVSLVNHFGKCIYDKYVKPTEEVTDYRTAVSGIRPDDIKDGEDIRTVQKEVAEILKGRILVGHAIHNDLKILLLDHPKKMIRDTQKYKPFRRRVKSARPALRVLCKEILNVQVQKGEHSSVQDAQATMRLYTLEKKHWEAELKASRSFGRGKKSTQTQIST